MKRWGRVAWMVCVTAALVRCGSFEASPVPAAADAASDAPASDGAPSLPDGASPGDCKNDALHLCDSFDDRAAAFAPALWTRDEGGGLGVLSPPARSAPNALAIESPEASPGQYFLVRRFEDVRSVTCSFALMMDGPRGTDFGVPFIVRQGPYTYRLRVPQGAAASLEVAREAADARESMLSVLSPKAWHTVEVTLPELTTLRVDGRDFASPAPGAQPGEVLVFFGLLANNGTTGWSVRIDDVRCTATL